MGGVDEKLLREGRLRRLEHASDVEIRAPRPQRPAPAPRPAADRRPDPRRAAERPTASGSSSRSVVVLDRVHEHRGVGGVHLAGRVGLQQRERLARPATSRSSQASSDARGRITGMRSCTGATSVVRRRRDDRAGAQRLAALGIAPARPQAGEAERRAAVERVAHGALLAVRDRAATRRSRRRGSGSGPSRAAGGRRTSRSASRRAR